MHDIVVTEFMDEAALAPLAARYRVHYDPELHADAAAIVRLARGARALVVRNRTRVDAALLAGCPALRVVGRLGVGLDNIDLPACAARGIPVEAAVGTNDVSVAEHTFAALLWLHKSALRRTADVARGQWPRSPAGNNEIAGRTLGIIGLGRIGRRVAARALAFDLHVQACDPALEAGAFAAAGVRQASLDDLLRTSDIVSLHCPLNDSSRGMLDAARLSTLRPGAVLLNTARGGILDESAVVAMVRDGRLGGALLDVFGDEPLAADAGLADVPNLLLSAHTAGLTQEAFSRASHHVADRVRQTLDTL
ncbi:hydroxyacid dehydrogenase [Bordetella genomosp. 13]|uniref:hydroxyacid dehydrogenase n=1 Tax=Bordetella genomosp. 13 TaxID=463040 RepID=UPI0011A33FA5|nr:hydroxyacid dehydrogenase [Bordetella genomosp. 13]